MKLFNICTKQTYEKDGAEKAKWLVCGTLKELDDGKRFITLNHLPDVSFYVFEPKKKETVSSNENPHDWAS
jgi:hypothetical protein